MDLGLNFKKKTRYLGIYATTALSGSAIFSIFRWIKRDEIDKKKHCHADMRSLNENWHLLGTKIGMSVNEVEKGGVSVLATNV